MKPTEIPNAHTISQSSTSLAHEHLLQEYERKFAVLPEDLSFRETVETMLPQPFDHICFAVSKFTTRTLRHESSIPRDEDGAVRFDDLIERLKEHFVSTLQWTVMTLSNFLAKGGGRKKRFQYCLNPCSSDEFLYFRAIQGHSGEIFVDPILQDNHIVTG